MKTDHSFNTLLKITGVLLILFFMLAALNSCRTPKTLYSRLWDMDGKIAPWMIDGEGTFEKDTVLFIDEITGYVEFKYTTRILSTEYADNHK